jgi:hypothetical protein
LLISTFGGFFFAHEMHVVTPGIAASRAAGISAPQMLQFLLGNFRSFFMTNLASFPL